MIIVVVVVRVKINVTVNFTPNPKLSIFSYFTSGGIEPNDPKTIGTKFILEANTCQILRIPILRNPLSYLLLNFIFSILT